MNKVCEFIPYGWNKERVCHNGTVEDIVTKVHAGAKFVCGTHARLFSELCCRLGYRTRRVWLLRKNAEHIIPFINVNDARHWVVEVDLCSASTVPYYKKREWVVFDPTLNLTFLTTDGLKANALQIHQACLKYPDPVAEAALMVCGGEYEPVIPSGPIYGLTENGWEVIMTEERVAEIYPNFFVSQGFPYYGYLCYYPEMDREKALIWVDEQTPEINYHLSRPLEETVGCYRFVSGEAGSRELYG